MRYFAPRFFALKERSHTIPSFSPTNMGPPSRYSLIEPEQSSHNTQTSQRDIEAVDTSRLSNTEWARYHLRQLAMAENEDEYDLRAGQALARCTNLTVNGLHVSRDNYALQWGSAFSAAGSIQIHSAMETPRIPVPTYQVRMSSDRWLERFRFILLAR